MLLFADYETYYDEDYTLKKMTPAEYILDPRFEAHGMAVQHDDKPETVPSWVDGPSLPKYFEYIQTKQRCGEKITMITFNALFDMCITTWRYGFVPDLMIDVLGMARAHFGPALTRFSLKALAEHMELPQGLKGDVIHKVRGMSTAQIQSIPMLWQEFKAYAKQDVRLMLGIYRRLMPAFPVRELGIMDLVLRCGVQPQFRYDLPLLQQHLADTKAHKLELLATAGLTPDENGKCPELMSAVKFKKLLEDLGETVPDKTTPTGRLAPAIAKTDQYMQDLLEHDDETIAALAAARLGHKSTLEETRAQRFINIASLPSAVGFTAGSAPIPLRYGAAHTHRLGGEWQLNKQNLPRKSKLRQSLTVEDGKEVVTADEAQIEARISATLARDMTLLNEFAEKRDPYGQLGATVFGLQWTPKFKTEYPVERFIGKTGILGLGYGAGAPKFHTMVTSSSRTMLTPEQREGFEFTEQDAQKTVRIYRTRYWRMEYTWNYLGRDGMAALTGQSVSCVFPPVVIKRGMIWGPNGQRMVYPDLECDKATGEWSYRNGNQRAKIYGAKLLENITQWLARIVVMEAGLRLWHTYGLRYALQAHDELVYVCDKSDTERVQKIVKFELERRPSWLPDCPLEAEVGRGPNYGAAK